jgi:GNAT superfamily N-acetyltransferase
MRIPAIREHLRWRGPWIVFLLSLRELLRPLLYWHIWLIYETDLIREFPQPYSRSILDVVIYTSQDDLSFIKPRLVAMGELSALEIETRFNRGDVVAFASTSGELVGYMWMAFSSGIELKFDTCWIIRTGEALRYGAFVVPSLRGRGIYSVLNSALNSYALERGVTSTLGSISILNPQSLSLPKHYNRRISMTVLLARTRLLPFTLRKSFRAPLHSRFSWPGHPPPPTEPRQSNG